jgi:hypothetical protein
VLHAGGVDRPAQEASPGQTVIMEESGRPDIDESDAMRDANDDRPPRTEPRCPSDDRLVTQRSSSEGASACTRCEYQSTYLAGRALREGSCNLTPTDSTMQA